MTSEPYTLIESHSNVPSRNCSDHHAQDCYREKRIAAWEEIAEILDSWHGLGGYYHARITQVFRHHVQPGQRVLELGCGQGDLLAALKPAVGVGVDFSPTMINRARARHPNLIFMEKDVHGFSFDGQFDIIILSDLVNDLWDVQQVLHQVASLAAPGARIIINWFSYLWEQPLVCAQKLRLATPLRQQNWLTIDDLCGLLKLENFDVINDFQEVLFPFQVWPVHQLCNRFLVKTWPFRHLALTNFLIARPITLPAQNPAPTVSVIIPARNEAGNIAELFARIPDMGSGTEIIFVEGGSVDNTYEVIEREMAAHPRRTCRLFRQYGTGKGDAVRLGFSHATGDILMILDADITVPPEDLTRFYDAISSGKGEFINGVRLVYPMEKQAMRFLNLIGNKLFSSAFSWLLGQPIKDTLCGTKVLWKKDYEQIAAGRHYFGNFDPFGDFDLLFGAAKLNLKIVQIPIRYRERKYGDTSISRFRHGLQLFRMVLFAMRKLKFY